MTKDIAALSLPVSNSRAEAIRECIAIADTFTCGLCGMDGEVGDALRALLNKEAEYIAVTDNNEFTRDNVEKTTAANTALYEAWLAERSSPSLPLNNNPQPDSRAEVIGVKPLEWQRRGEGLWEWWSSGDYDCKKTTTLKQAWVLRRCGVELSKQEYLQDAMSDAQADYETRIRSALLQQEGE